MIKQTVMAFILTLMEQNTRAFGKMIYSMARERKYGQMVQSMKENTRKVKSMALDSMYGQMEVHMRVIGLTIKLMGKVNTFG